MDDDDDDYHNEIIYIQMKNKKKTCVETMYTYCRVSPNFGAHRSVKKDETFMSLVYHFYKQIEWFES